MTTGQVGSSEKKLYWLSQPSSMSGLWCMSAASGPDHHITQIQVPISALTIRIQRRGACGQITAHSNASEEVSEPITTTPTASQLAF